MSITTSWDDGHPLDFRIAELLTKYGLSGTFYVPIKNMRPTLTAPEIRQLSQCFEIGGHTVNHVRLGEVDERTAKAEIVDCKRKLEDILGTCCSTFCFPGGSHHSAHIAMLREAGFKAARTVELMSLQRPYFKMGIAIVPTTIQAYSHTVTDYCRNLTKRANIRGFMNLFSCSFTRQWALVAEALLEKAVEQGGVFHLWGHSWEIEDCDQWQALNYILSKLAECKKFARVCTNTELCANE